MQPPDALTLDRQHATLATEISRRILAGAACDFAVVEISAAETSFRWPDSPQGVETTDGGRAVFRGALRRRLPASGVWCILDGIGRSDAAVRLEVGPFATPAAENSSGVRAGAISPAVSAEMADVIRRGSQRELTAMLTQMRGDFRWVGFHAVRCELETLGPLLRYCEHVFAAVDASTPLNRGNRRLIESWRREGVSLDAAWLVAA